MAFVPNWLALKASGNIGARRIVALENTAQNFAGTKGEALQADGNRGALIGVSGRQPVRDGATVEVAPPGSVAEVVYGGNVESGDLLTSNASGRAVATTSQTHRIVGIAMIDGAANDIGEVLIAPGII